MKNLTYLSILLFIYSCGTEAQKTVSDYAESITETELKTHLNTYASDEFGSRSGYQRRNLSHQFLKRLLKSTGVSGGSTDGSYFQEMTVTDRSGN